MKKFLMALIVLISFAGCFTSTKDIADVKQVRSEELPQVTEQEAVEAQTKLDEARNAVWKRIKKRVIKQRRAETNEITSGTALDAYSNKDTKQDEYGNITTALPIGLSSDKVLEVLSTSSGLSVKFENGKLSIQPQMQIVSPNGDMNIEGAMEALSMEAYTTGDKTKFDNFIQMTGIKEDIKQTSAEYEIEKNTKLINRYRKQKRSRDYYSDIFKEGIKSKKIKSGAVYLPEPQLTVSGFFTDWIFFSRFKHCGVMNTNRFMKGEKYCILSSGGKDFDGADIAWQTGYEAVENWQENDPDICVLNPRNLAQSDDYVSQKMDEFYNQYKGTPFSMVRTDWRVYWRSYTIDCGWFGRYTVWYPEFYIYVGPNLRQFDDVWYCTKVAWRFYSDKLGKNIEQGNGPLIRPDDIYNDQGIYYNSNGWGFSTPGADSTKDLQYVAGAK